MLSSLFAVFALATSPVETTAYPIEVEIEVSATEFCARNYTDCHQLLVFRESERTLLRVLPAGGTVAWSFPCHALAGVEFEVVSERSGAWSHTEALVLGDVVALGIERVWIQAGDPHPILWAETAGGLALLTPRGSSSALDLGTPIQMHIEIGSEIGPTHVPVITPSDTPEGDLPPELEKTPLPPV